MVRSNTRSEAAYEELLDCEGGRGAPRVSVVVVCYNQGKYIREALNSVLAQGYPVFEIVVYDDASSDDSLAIARSWAAGPGSGITRILAHAHNLGITKTLNDAVAATTGTYIVFTAADDVLLPGGIESRLRYLEERPDKLAVFGNCQVMDEGGTITHSDGIKMASTLSSDLFEIDWLLPHLLVFRWGMCGPVFMCRKEMYSILGPYDEGLFFEDLDMYLRIASSGRLGFINCSVANYRKYSSSTCQAKSFGTHVRPAYIKSATYFSGIRRAYLTFLAYRRAPKRPLPILLRKTRSFIILLTRVLFYSYLCILIAFAKCKRSCSST